MHYRLDAGEWRDGPATGVSVPISGDRVHELEYHARDVAGNVEPTRTLEVKIDTTPPQASLERPAAGAAYVLDAELPVPRLPLTLALSDITAGATATDAVSGVGRFEWYVNGTHRATSPGAPTANWTWRASAEGLGFHNLEVRVFDAAGNPTVRGRDVLTVPTTLTGAFATHCGDLAGPTCDVLPPTPPVPPPDFEALDQACRDRLHPAVCDALVAILGPLL